MPLVAHYNFEQSSGNLSDVTDGSHDSTAVTISSRSSPGILGGNSWDFDGSNDEADLPAFSFNEYTLAAWTRYDAKNGNYDYVFTFRDGYYLHIGKNNSDELYWFHNDGSNTLSGTLAPSEWSTNTWYLQVMTYDGSTARGYLDGEEVVSASVSGHTNQGGGNFIGGAGSQNFLDGQVSQAWIYDHALTPHDVQYLYEVGYYGDYVTSVKTQ